MTVKQKLRKITKESNNSEDNIKFQLGYKYAQEFLVETLKFEARKGANSYYLRCQGDAHMSGIKKYCKEIGLPFSQYEWYLGIFWG